MGFFLQPRHYSSFIIQNSSLLFGGLVIEVDGDVHDLQKEEDERRNPLCPSDCFATPKYDNGNLG